MPVWLVVLLAAAALVIVMPYVVALVAVLLASTVGRLGAIADRIGRQRIDRAYDERGEDEAG